MSDKLKLLIDRRFLLLGGSGFALAACGGILPSPILNQIYVLSPAKSTATSGPKVNWALAVDTPDAMDSLDTIRIAIMRTADTMDYYANAQWPDRLPKLVARALVEGFEASDRIDQVGRSEDALHANYVLQTQMLDFEARYDTPDGAPTIVVRIQARLVAQRTRRSVGSFLAEQKAPASANSIDAAVEAFDTALGAAVVQIVDWALSAAPPV